MEIYFNKVEYERLYRCDYLNESQWRGYVVQRPYTGVLVLVLGLIYLITYVPCLIIMNKKQFFENSCFKIMFFHGILDCVAIVVNSFVTGGLLISGTVFCLNPRIQYFAGTAGIAIWCGQCLNCTILAINRCLDFWWPRLSVVLFDGYRTYFSWALVLVYAGYFAVFTNPITLSSAMIMWLYDPTRGGSSQLKIQLQLLKQASLICLLNFIPGFIFLVSLFMHTPPIVVFVGLLTWQMGNGGGGVVLLAINNTIRKQVLEMIFKSRFSGSSVGPSLS
ncbi:hypothetical protein QR680_014376 [Steinernema hermaphroditum]|uniref:7TM GPCR serpentine receptor class x (Srx) domain-containing protein n=1 Tax=Steinernema hermaphroditum TaxID=289476 RepID=A0AA39IA17_9BILA|nr:hypothetical protein QR680_014376 [Steinernema hermaphroditum]